MIAMIALYDMAQLLVRNIPDELVKKLKLRAAEHGVSAEEEHRRILAEAMIEANMNSNEARVKALLGISRLEGSDDLEDWLFDRNDPRNRNLERRDQGLFDD
ncbi:MAG: hypothetical protein HC845_11015 [Akkermansiaceae bacterium]|nr:hypothetical protein [Akkermansiaceae bacterium]